MKKLIFAFGLLSIALSALVFDLANVRSTVMAVTSGWVINGDDVYFTDGKVGIGTNSPEEIVHVASLPTDGPTKLSEVFGGDGEFSLPESTLMDTEGDLLFVSSGFGIEIIDMSDPNDPDLINTVSNSISGFSSIQAIKGFDVLGDYMYVVAYGPSLLGSFSVIDISDPTNPSMEYTVEDGTSGYTFLNEPKAIAALDDYVYFINENNWITTVNATNKSAPYVANTVKANNVGTYPSYMRLFDEHLYLSYNQAVYITSVENRNSPTYKGRIQKDTGDYSLLQGNNRVYVDKDILYVASNQTDAINIVDVTDKTSPSFITEIHHNDGTFSKLEMPDNITVYRGVAAIAATLSDAVVFVDVTDPSNPSLISEVYDGDGTYNKLDAVRLVAHNKKYIYATSVTDKGLVAFGNVFMKDHFLVSDQGKVGIGTLAPVATLDVDGFMRLEVNSSAPITCDATTDGSIAVSSNYYTCICKNGTGWVKTADGSTSCSW